MRLILPMLVAMFLSLPALLQAQTDDRVRAGDSMQTVIDILGRPQGVIEMGEKQVLFFDRGEIVLKGGSVVKVDILTAEAHQQDRVEKERARQESERMAEVRRQQRIERGEIQKRKKLSDPLFLSAAAGDRLRYWSKFRRNYPEVDISAELNEAQSKYKAEVERIEQERRIAELEERVRLAEDRARRSERDRPYYRFPTYYGGYSRGYSYSRGGTYRSPYRRGSSARYVRHSNHGGLHNGSNLHHGSHHIPASNRHVFHHKTVNDRSVGPGTRLHQEQSITISGRHHTVRHVNTVHHNVNGQRSTTTTITRSGSTLHQPQVIHHTSPSRTTATTPNRFPTFFAADFRR